MINAIDDAARDFADAYRAIATRLEVLPVKVKLPRLFQVDLNLVVTTATLGPAVVAELERGVELERRLGGEASETQWSRFRDAFTTRYEGREVPLVEVLDEKRVSDSATAARRRKRR
jgi:hypothetical protein